MMISATEADEVQQLLISRPETYPSILGTNRAHRLQVISALGFPSKTSAEIAPDHPKSSEAAFAHDK
jgi:hypothetical protein